MVYLILATILEGSILVPFFTDGLSQELHLQRLPAPMMDFSNSAAYFFLTGFKSTSKYKQQPVFLTEIFIVP